MRTHPYRSADRVFWVVDNGSSHRGQAAINGAAIAFLPWEALKKYSCLHRAAMMNLLTVTKGKGFAPSSGPRRKANW